MGVSIGLEGSVKDTATLGGYIDIDGIPHILTVHHLFTDDDSGEVFRPGTAITQPSLQEVKEVGDMLNRLKSSEHSFHIECVKSLLENMKACLPEFSFGHLERSSGYRNRPSREGSSNIEMDWAICKVDKKRIGSNISSCQNHRCQGISAVTPGGAVFAIGRTSGQQSGNINGSTTYLFLRNDDGDYRVSEEWAVLRPESQGEDTWVTSGIGVAGDSGAWIMEAGTDNLIGQLWGRDFQEESDNDETGEIITYFTPIQDMFDDILQSTWAIEISISLNGKPDKEGKQKGKEKKSSLEGSLKQTCSTGSRHGGVRSNEQNFNIGTTAFTVATTADCKKNCGICHEPVNEERHKNIRSAPRHSPRSGMMVMMGTGGWGPRTGSIAKAEEDINKLIADIDRLKYDREVKRGILS